MKAISKTSVKIVDNKLRLKVVTDDLIDEIIETVLRFIDCEHEVDKEEDGIHHSVFYSVETGCEEAIRDVLEGKDGL